MYDCETGGIFSPAHEEEEMLVDLYREPYEEAVKIVDAMPLPLQPKKSTSP